MACIFTKLFPFPLILGLFMPLRSMTGFGRAEGETSCGICRIEIRAVNNRFLDVQTRSPKVLSSFDSAIKKIVGETISRGSVSLFISLEEPPTGDSLTWDKDAVKAYIRILREIQKTHKLAGELTMSDLLKFNDFIKTDKKEVDETKLFEQVKPVLRKAIEAFQKTREREAALIASDLKKMLKEISTLVKKVKVRAPIRLKAYQDVLTQKIKTLAGDIIEPARLTTEVAIMADRLDISEECTRLAVHVQKFIEDFDANEPVGKRLNFVNQEMHREANTISSKANDAEISQISVRLREIIEQIREQIQNIE
jgi:uncharacterized protein (TIGR00255 family)